MSYVNNVLTACPTLQSRLNQAWLYSKGITTDEKMPFAQFLMDPINNNGIQMNIVPGGGKVRTWQVKYAQRLQESDVNTNQSNPACDAGIVPEDVYTNYTLDTSVNYQSPGVKLTPAALEGVCEGNDMIFEQFLLRDMDVLRRKVSSVISTQAAALYGYWSRVVPHKASPSDGEVDSDDEKLQVSTTQSNGNIQPRTHTWISNATIDSGFPANLLIVGGKTIREHYQVSAAGCCANEGLDVGQLFAQFGYAWMYDYRVESALGDADQFMVVAPGALQVLEYLVNPWKDGMPPEAYGGANYVHRTLTDPQTGYQYDWTVADDCGTLYSNLTWTGKVIGLPSDIFAPGLDVNDGLTYVAKGKVVNP